jgi:hypothetical protein
MTHGERWTWPCRGVAFMLRPQGRGGVTLFAHRKPEDLARQEPAR